MRCEQSRRHVYLDFICTFFLSNWDGAPLGVGALRKLRTLHIDPFNVCKHRKPRLGARAAWGQKNGAANRPAYCVKEKQTSLIDR